MDDLAQRFEAERPRLLRVAYRLTGRLVEAEDAVQDVWLRLQRAEIETIRDLPAWLTTTVSRLCLDRLTSATARRESYIGTWLPEPVVTSPGEQLADPLAAVVRDEDVRYAAMVVLEALTPPQRVAFVLHDGFGVPFAQIAEVLDVSAANARQLASRARSAVSVAPPPVGAEEHIEVLGRLVTAVLERDVDAVVAALDPEVRMVGDADGLTPTARRMLHGPAEVANFMIGLMRRYGPAELATMRMAEVNGRLGLAFAGTGGRLPARVTAFAVRDGRVWGIWDIANPEKLGGVRLDDWSPVQPPPRRARRR